MRLRTAAVAATLALLAPLAITASADAEVVDMPDAVGDGAGDDGGSHDLARVRVRHAPRQVVLKLVSAEPYLFSHQYNVWVDLDPRDPGPEKLIRIGYEVVPEFTVHDAETFRDLDGTTRCELDTARPDSEAGILTVTVPRRCLNLDGVRQDRIRVAAESHGEVGRHDWVPGRRSFGPWVAAGRLAPA